MANPYVLLISAGDHLGAAVGPFQTRELAMAHASKWYETWQQQTNEAIRSRGLPASRITPLPPWPDKSSFAAGDYDRVITDHWIFTVAPLWRE